MFIREQMAEFSELQMEFRNESECIDRWVWSPVACRHCMWTFEPLVRVYGTGRPIHGSRQRNPFPPYR